ncbi:MAG: dephospho-CoA kinase [Prevotella sp.]|uniref:dephospho-CoA kinase n=1 Tax=Prevotella sp. P3-122 TaxID=2024223 RepID=UPI000B968EAF|nr:dephospho-CoA kinase [Prevotella sp. P3-122]MCI6182063.1 dephospho-CoA kinase [Prevotella sp.]MCI6310111.1 dephospho-CoA kinase [Prevotella sp.]MCI6462573.1 dephospho-CoA kinase [Prevotella sp.]MCI6500521.1 dephospho-CoA kinase [Prevotella sp.]MCI7340723.1 dephospho-CoA kinase [Prevotella sp.]
MTPPLSPSHIAITGGIGSGKSFVCDILRRRGFGVYDCDAAAKRLMATDKDLQRELSQLVGNGVYSNGVLQKSVLAQFILESEDNKQAVNHIVHPAVAADYLSSGCQWLESAILFDANFDQRVTFDIIIGVVAPDEVRTERIMTRDGISREQALQWIGCQMPQETVARLCDYIISNGTGDDVEAQVEDICMKLNIV